MEAGIGADICVLLGGWDGGWSQIKGGEEQQGSTKGRATEKSKARAEQQGEGQEQSWPRPPAARQLLHPCPTSC